MCNILAPVVADPQVAALSPSRVCSSQLDVALTSFQTSFHLQLSRSSRQDIVWALPYVGDSGHSRLLPSRSGKHHHITTAKKTPQKRLSVATIPLSSLKGRLSCLWNDVWNDVKASSSCEEQTLLGDNAATCGSATTGTNMLHIQDCKQAGLFLWCFCGGGVVVFGVRFCFCGAVVFFVVRWSFCGGVIWWRFACCHSFISFSFLLLLLLL